MSSLKLFSLYRHASLSTRSSLSVAFGIPMRCFTSVTSPRPSPLTSQFPKVANSAEVPNLKAQTWVKQSEQAKVDMSRSPLLNPYSGRTVSVKDKGGVGESLRMLDGILSRNKVKLQLRMTERHEKKGYKRRRLASERWRNQFANEVRKKVQLVMKMRDRGA